MPNEKVLLRALAATGIAWGGVLLARPRLVAETLCPEFPADRDWIARVLGARLVLQDTLLFAKPGRGTAVAASVVDGLHALSMLPFLGSERYRRAAVISGAPAAFGTLATALLARD